MTTIRTSLLAFTSALGLAATAQNTFFSEYGQGNGGMFESVMRCANGDFVCVDDSWYLMMRTDSLGNVLWANHGLPHPSIRSGAPVETANGDLLVLASQYDTATTRFNMALVRTDAQGNVLAADAFPVDTLKFFPWRSAALSNGMIAHIATAWNSQEVVIMVFDPSGPYAYPRIRIPVNFPTQGNLPAGFTGVFAGSNSTFFTYHGSYSPTLILTKYTTTGVSLWNKSYVVDGGTSTIGMAGTMLSSGNLALLVEVLSGGPGGEYVLLLNPSGDVISTRRLIDADNAFDWDGDVAPLPDGSFVVHLVRNIVDPDKGDILVHMDANADVIAQYGLEPGIYVNDVIAVDNDRLALVGNSSGNNRSLSVMALNGPLPSCWVPDSVAVVPVVATGSAVTFASTTYTSGPLPAAVTTMPQTLPRTPACGTVGLGTLEKPQSLTLYPSPSADGRFTVQGEGVASGDRYEVFNVQGVRCAEGKLPADARLDLARLAPGSYVLRLFAADGFNTIGFVR